MVRLLTCPRGLRCKEIQEVAGQRSQTDQSCPLNACMTLQLWSIVGSVVNEILYPATIVVGMLIDDARFVLDGAPTCLLG